MKTQKYKIIILGTGIIFFLNGCIPLLIGAGIGLGVKAVKSHNVKNKQTELETKENYGKYRIEMQQKDNEAILTYEEWMDEQENSSEKTKSEG